MAKVTGAEASGEKLGEVTGVITDSRAVKRGDCFFAIAGENFDGHDYVESALKAGAVCAVVSRDVGIDGTILKVNDTIRALGRLAADYRGRLGVKVVAITGSVGKTTTRLMAAHVLGTRYKVFQSPKNFNNEIGVPLSILGAEDDDEILLVELGTNHPGEIGYLSRIARPDIAVVTTARPAHLEGFGSLEAIIKEKLSIADGLRHDGLFIINGDDAGLMSGVGRKCVTFGTAESLDYRCGDIEVRPRSSRMRIGRTMVTVPVAGIGNIYNAIAAWAICSQFGISEEEFGKAIGSMKSPDMRTQILDFGSVTVISDCYNANPTSMFNAVEMLACFGDDERGRTVFICGDMAELGEQGQGLHESLGRFVASKGVDVLLTAGQLARFAADAAMRKAPGKISTHFFEDTKTLCDNLREIIEETDIILVKGSRLSELEKAVDKLKQLFLPSAGDEADKDVQEVK